MTFQEIKRQVDKELEKEINKNNKIRELFVEALNHNINANTYRHPAGFEESLKQQKNIVKSILEVLDEE